MTAGFPDVDSRAFTTLGVSVWLKPSKASEAPAIFKKSRLEVSGGLNSVSISTPFAYPNFPATGYGAPLRPEERILFCLFHMPSFAYINFLKRHIL
jgi:hypothetical protein